MAFEGIGLWAPLRLWLNEAAVADTAAELEELGFGSLWLGNGPQLLELAVALLGATQRTAVASGVLNIWAAPAGQVCAATAELRTRHPGRFMLGLGGGWPPDPQPGAADRPPTPYAKLVGFLDELDAAPTPVPSGGRMLAALGPRMLALAAARSAGAHPFLVTPEHTRRAREILGPRASLVPEQKVILEPDATRARSLARGVLDFYLTKPNYAASVRRLGFAADDFAAGGSDRLVDSLVAWGTDEAVLRRIDEHRQAGADSVAVQVLAPETGFNQLDRRRLPLTSIRRLAQLVAG